MTSKARQWVGLPTYFQRTCDSTCRCKESNSLKIVRLPIVGINICRDTFRVLKSCMGMACVLYTTVAVKLLDFVPNSNLGTCLSRTGRCRQALEIFIPYFICCPQGSLTAPSCLLTQVLGPTDQMPLLWSRPKHVHCATCLRHDGRVPNPPFLQQGNTHTSTKVRSYYHGGTAQPYYGTTDDGLRVQLVRPANKSQ